MLYLCTIQKKDFSINFLGKKISVNKTLILWKK